MKHYRYFDEATGLLHPMTVKATSPSDALAATPLGHKIIEGELDFLSQRVDLATGTVVDYMPAQPSAEHKWDEYIKRWVLNQAATDQRDAERSAKARIQVLENQERGLLRRLVLDPTDADARTSLAAIDAEIAEQEKLSAK